MKEIITDIYMIFLLYTVKKQKSVFFNEIDNEGRCLTQLHSQTRSIFLKGEVWGQTHPKFLDKQKNKKKNNGQIRENPYPGVGEGVLSL